MARYVLACVLLLTSPVLGGELSLHRDVTVPVPEGWRVAEKWEVERSQRSSDFADPAIAERMKQNEGATETLVILAKREAEHVGMNPSIHVTRTRMPQQLAGATPKRLIEVAFPVLTRAFHDVRVEEWAPEIVVGDRAAAKTSVSYTLRGKSGRATAARASIVVVPDGDGFFIIGYSSPASGEDDVREIFKKFLASVRFAKPVV